MYQSDYSPRLKPGGVVTNITSVWAPLTGCSAWDPVLTPRSMLERARCRTTDSQAQVSHLSAFPGGLRHLRSFRQSRGTTSLQIVFCPSDSCARIQCHPPSVAS